MAFDWEHNLGHHKTYIGDQTLHAYFEDGFTVTFPKFKGAKNIIISKNKRKSKTISKLKAKKKYYIRIRTYKKLKGNGKSYNIYSSWSKIKTKKVK